MNETDIVLVVPANATHPLTFISSLSRNGSYSNNVVDATLTFRYL